MSTDLQVLKSLHILFADDDDLIRESISRILSMFFGKVYTAIDGIEALEIYNQNKIDVVLLDFVMPNINGNMVAKQIRATNKKIPIILASAHTDKEKLLESISLNLVKFIEKPIMFEDLQATFIDVLQILNENNMLLTPITPNISYNFITKKMINNSEEIQLSKNEVSFIELLLSKPNQFFSKETIEAEVFEESVDENTLRNMVYRLRKRFDESFIITVKDFGYLLKI